ncbi:MAG: hypothetical protein ABSB09_11410 [Acidimicrobiales bacterium]|jgi:hypothetical protein
MRLTDIDQLLRRTSQISGSTPARQLRDQRNQLAHAAVLLSYARNVLSIDVGVLQSALGGTIDLQTTVDELPGILASASIGGGWSLSSDSPIAMASARQALQGEAEDMLSAHGRIADMDVRRPESVQRVLDDVEEQLELVAELRESVERSLREHQTAIVERYKSGDAHTDDWLD